MWERKVDGRPLTFHLAGINNQNFIMRDEETGTWWQQVSGEAIAGPLKGKHLSGVFNDEIAFRIWKAEGESGRVLRPDPRVASRYASPDWERQIERMPLVTRADPSDALEQRSLVVGVSQGGADKAYPFEALRAGRVINDQVGSTPLFLAVGEDGRSVRAFARTINGKKLEFFAQTDAQSPRFIDRETGSTWDFSGRAVAGPLLGAQLPKISALKDYWFDWKIYHPRTSIYTVAVPSAQR